MRIGIVSDTHDQVGRTTRAIELLVAAGIEAVVHCGDLTGPAVVDLFAGIPSYFVFGNNDFDERGLRRAMAAIDADCLGRGGEIELGGRRLAVTHGDSDREIRRLAARGPDYLFFGHSHVPTDHREGATRWINPGALHRSVSKTVGVLDLATDTYTLLILDDTGSRPSRPPRNDERPG